MSTVWIKEDAKYTWTQRFVMSFLKRGPLPRHAAIIMDGNRRFASKNSIEKIQGHTRGFEKLTETLEWCRDLGINEVTVYAFSIENFKRSKEEVDGLISLATEKFEKLLEEKEQLDKHGVRVRIIGNLELLPQKLRSLCAEITLCTAANSNACLNVCLSYTSREEMSNAVKVMCEGVQDGLLLESDLTEELTENCLYTSEMPPVDLLIRTSGEVRLSDFLMWQGGFATLSFVNVLWPDFSLWHLFAAVFQFQRNQAAINDARKEHNRVRQLQQRELDLMTLFKEEEEEEASVGLEERIQAFRAARDRRTAQFLAALRARRLQQLENMRSAPLEPLPMTA